MFVQKITTDNNRYKQILYRYIFDFLNALFSGQGEDFIAHTVWTCILGHFAGNFTKKRAKNFFSLFLKNFFGNQESDALFDLGNRISDPKNIKSPCFQTLIFLHYFLT